MMSNLDGELWLPVAGRDGYFVSNHGRVFSAARRINCGPNGGFRDLPATMLRPFVCKHTGYKQVTFSGHDKRNVHRLVAETFLPPGRPDQLHVNHMDSDRTNPRLDNLEWVTPGENTAHSFRETARVGSAKGKFSAAHATSKAVISTDICTGEVKNYPCASDAVRAEVGLDSGSISRCCTGKMQKHKGRKWEFAPAP